MKLLITIDTECDNGWDYRQEITTENARFLPRFQALCDKFGYKCTYLTTYEMAQDKFYEEFASEVLKRGVGEVGTIGAPPAVIGAVCDALDVAHIDMPTTPEKVWRALAPHPE